MKRALWWRAHRLVNALAWRFAKPPGPVFGSALRIDQSHPLWRLNSWLAAHYVPQLIEEATRGTEHLR